MEYFMLCQGDVRENSVKLVAACYMHVGLRHIEGYLSHLQPAQRKLFDAEFERVSGTPVPTNVTPSITPLPPSIILEFDTKYSGKLKDIELDTEFDTEFGYQYIDENGAL